MSAANSIDTLKAIARRVMLEHTLQPDFDAAAQKQLASISAPAAAGTSLRDQRTLLWCSIDNDDSLDLDQLSVSESLPDGATRVLVAIADVDALVPLGSPIDEHARANTTSVYTVPQVFPMLPERLSTNLTSLADGQDRAAIVAEFTVQADGTISASDIYRSFVHNRAKLAYSSVGAWLVGKGPMPPRVAAVPGMDQQLKVQDQAAQNLRRQRHVHGALVLRSIEARPVFDGAALRDLRPDTPDRAKELIEDLMIAANGVAVRYLAAKGMPTIRRILRVPKAWDRIVALAATVHETLPAQPDAVALSQFLLRRQQANPDAFSDLSLSVIKLLGRGEYAVDLPGQPIEGHFGLAVRDYTHSTAPNRRYPDLITQRLLKAALTQTPAGYDTATLQALAAHCTKQEDNANKVERQVGKSAAAQLLSDRIGQSFAAVVTGAADKGTFVRIDSPTTEGKLMSGAAGLKVGDHLNVRLVHTDVERGFIDFERAG